MPEKPIARKRQLEIFVVSFLLYLLILLPIVFADRYHLEDWRRLIRGSYGWTGEGRPLADLLMIALNFGGSLKDISPLPQLLGIALLALATVFLGRKFAISTPLLAALAAFPLGASPFFLENLSFRFDSLAMCLSIVMALVPIFMERREGWTTWIIGAASLFGSLCFYQTGINAFLVFSVTELCTQQLANVSFPSVVRRAVHRLLQLIGGLIPYLLLAKLMVGGSYNVEHFKYVTKPSDLGIIKHNWDICWGRIFHSLPGSLRNVFMFPVLLATLVIIVAGFYYLKRSSLSEPGKLKSAVIVAGIFLLPLAWFTGSLGPLLFPVHALITLPRIYIGTGALLASSFVILCTAAAKLRISGKWVCLLLGIPAYVMVMLASIYGNVLVEQGRYEERIASGLSLDIQALARSHPIKELVVDGVVPYCPIVQHATREYNIVRVSRNLDSDRLLGDYAHHVYEYYGINLPPERSAERRSELIAKATETAPIISNGYYDIHLVDEALIVSFFGDIPKK